MTPLTKDQKEELYAQAEMVWEQLGVNNSPDYVEEVSRFVDSLHGQPWTEKELNTLAMRIGAYLGRAMLSRHSGRWYYEEERQNYAVKFNRVDVVAYPMTKAYKHLTNGTSDSIATMYWGIDAIINDKLNNGQ